MKKRGDDGDALEAPNKYLHNFLLLHSGKGASACGHPGEEEGRGEGAVW